MSASAPGPMRVSIDALPLADARRTGIGRYLESILPLLVEMAEGRAEFKLFAGRPICNPTALKLIQAGKVDAWNGHLPSLYAWQQILLGVCLREFRPSVHFTADGLLPLDLRAPAVGVVHDMIWKRYPGTASWHIRAVFGARQRASLEKLRVALTDSDATRRDLLRDYGKAAEKVRVVPLGVDTSLFHPSREGEQAASMEFRKRHGLPERYLLAIGNLMPHKNLRIVFEALGRLHARGEDFPALAVIGEGHPEREIAGMPAGFPQEKIRWLGFLSDEDVQFAYRCAEALVFPSLYEGFGLPILEAMASGTPVVHSGSTSLPEVAGAAGLEFDPQDAESLAVAIRRIDEDKPLRNELRERGLLRAKEFTWERCARAVWEAILEAAGA